VSANSFGAEEFTPAGVLSPKIYDCDSPWTPVSVIPAHAGIQAFFESVPRTHLNAGDRQHDGLSLHSGEIFVRSLC
jgi:hypothetical protein